ncbi:MAG: long-chain fatty acid--CoA ligase [Thermomicrobiales bacterium]
MNAPTPSSPWISHYPAGVEPEIGIPDITLPEMLVHTCERFGGRTCATFYGRDFSFQEIHDESNRFANRLVELGIRPGEPVMIILPNVPQFLIAAYGILKAGGILASINPLLTHSEIQKLVDDSGANLIVTLDRFWEDVEPLLDNGIVSTAIVTGIQDGLPRLKRWLYPLKYKHEMVEVKHEPDRGRHQYREFIKGGSSQPTGVSLSPSDVAVFQYTGGTTGLPKAAVLTHRNLVANANQVRAWLTDTVEGEETVMAILPFFHAYGGTLCLYLAIQLAARIILVPRFDVKDVMDLIEQYRPTILPGVPTLYNALNRAAENNPGRQEALTSIRCCVSGGAPLPPDVVRRFEKLTGGRLVEGYGLSEASPVTHVNPLDGRARNGAIGLPLPNTEVKLVDPDTGEPVALNERGELLVRGPQVMQGYWNKPEETASVLDDDGWLHTGDIATMDEDGFFRIVDRLKDVIITGGENIYPREIEDVLASHPKIQEAAVAGVSHKVGGEVAKAYIVLREGETMDRREVLRFCSEHLAKYKVPRQVEFRSELPKSAAGKILKRELEPYSPE